MRKFPTETSRYLEPIFNDLGQADVLFHVNPQTAWQVLAPAYEPPAQPQYPLVLSQILCMHSELPPDVNKSGLKFTPEEVRDEGVAAAQAGHGPF